MDGLERLTKKITDDATAQSEKIINEANRQADIIIKEAEEKAGIILAEGEKASEKKAELLLHGYEAAANSKGRKMLLSAKHELINAAFEKALSDLEGLDTKEYFEVLYKIIKKYLPAKAAELMLCNKDLSRLPADFADKLKEISDGRLVLSETSANIKNGFIIKCDTVEENCSFDSLIGTDSEKLRDKVAEILFEHKEN